MLGEPVEVDEESGAQIFLLGADERPADNIYGSSPTPIRERRIAIRYYRAATSPAASASSTSTMAPATRCSWKQAALPGLPPVE